MECIDSSVHEIKPLKIIANTFAVVEPGRFVVKLNRIGMIQWEIISVPGCPHSTHWSLANYIYDVPTHICNTIQFTAPERSNAGIWSQWSCNGPSKLIVWMCASASVCITQFPVGARLRLRIMSLCVLVTSERWWEWFRLLAVIECMIMADWPSRLCSLYECALSHYIMSVCIGKRSLRLSNGHDTVDCIVYLLNVSFSILFIPISLFLAHSPTHSTLIFATPHQNETTNVVHVHVSIGRTQITCMRSSRAEIGRWLYDAVPVDFRISSPSREYISNERPTIARPGICQR